MERKEKNTFSPGPLVGAPFFFSDMNITGKMAPLSSEEPLPGLTICTVWKRKEKETPSLISQENVTLLERVDSNKHDNKE